MSEQGQLFGAAPVRGMQRIGRFLSVRPMGKREWRVINNRGEMLGVIEWEPQWRQLVFQSHAGLTLSWDCLRDIAAFLEAKSSGAKP